MKTFILYLVLFLIPLLSFGQESFKVIKVNGTILLKEKNVSLETGTVFSEKEDLLFRNEDATAAVINSQKGRLILTNSNHDLSTARSNYLPSMYNISTRGGTTTTLTNLPELQNQFVGKCVILGRYALELDEIAFPMNSDHFFFLRYLYKGEEINKKIPFSGDTLIIDRKILYVVDGKPIDKPDSTSVKLFYRKGSETVQITESNFVFPDDAQLKTEIKVILDAVKTKPYKEQINEVNGYISEFYGKVYMVNLISWLDTSFGLKLK